MGVLLDGKGYARQILEEVRVEVATRMAAGLTTPCLAVVLVGEDPASEVYVRGKVRACGETGIRSLEYKLDAATDQATLEALVDRLNEDVSIHGMLIQLPLPKHLDTKAILHRVNPEKDVDGFHPTNQGLLFQGAQGLRSCTPSAVMRMLELYGLPLEGKRALVVGRSEIVGKPMALMLLEANATVTIAHSRTKDLPSLCREADLLVAAIGRPGMIEGPWIKPGAVVVDVGINRVEDLALGERIFASEPLKFARLREKGHVLCGDVRFGEAIQVASAVTPVPGGVGPLTIAGLMRNTLQAAIGLG